MSKRSIAGAVKPAPRRKAAEVPKNELTHNAGQELSDVDDLREPMSTWPTERLIEHAVQCQRYQKRAKMEESLCLELLADRFPCLKMEEEIRTPAGVALRKVKNTYLVNADRIDDLRKTLGTRFGSFVDEVKTGHVPQDRIAPLKDVLGREWKRFIVYEVGYKPTRLLSTRLSRGEEPAEEVEGMVSVITEPKVTVKPLDS